MRQSQRNDNNQRQKKMYPVSIQNPRDSVRSCVCAIYSIEQSVNVLQISPCYLKEFFFFILFMSDYRSEDTLTGASHICRGRWQPSLPPQWSLPLLCLEEVRVPIIDSCVSRGWLASPVAAHDKHYFCLLQSSLFRANSPHQQTLVISSHSQHHPSFAQPITVVSHKGS
jgi:hypothetical protein